jgi:DNA-binding CsgD family transcriptional regulator
MGYQYFYIIIWAMWAVLARKLEIPVTRIVCACMTAIMAGQLLGSIIGAQLIVLATNSSSTATIAAVLVFFILLVALFAFDNPALGSELGILPHLTTSNTTPRFKRSLRKLAEMRGLSARETEVLELLARGRNRSYISTQLVISEETTKTHIKRIYRKFGVHSQQTLLDMIELDGKSD